MNKMKITSAILALALILCGVRTNAQFVHHGELTGKGSLYFRAEPVNNLFTDKTGDVWYYIHLQGTEKQTSQSKKHVPLNISVVIDRSGSMEGDKLNYTKQAVKYLVNQLDPKDVISIVTYETGVEVLLQPQRIEDKTDVLNKIDGIVTAGSTNLEGGIRKGYELVKYSKKLLDGEMVNRVLLLSDGLANVGMSDPAQLSQLTNSFFTEDHISISTFGVGTDYNEDLMAKIAMQGGGKYYFIGSPETLPKVFSEELQGMSQVIAKNTVLRIKFPNDVLSYDRTFAYNSSLNDNTLEISFNDIFAKEQKSILIGFKAKGKLKAPFTLQCDLQYDNTAGDSVIHITDNRKTDLRQAKDDGEYKTGYNRAASEGFVMEITSEMYEDAVKLCDDDHFDEAKAKVKNAMDLLDNHFKTIGENTFLRDLYNKLEEYAKLIDDMKHMDKESVRYNVKFHKQKCFRTVSCPSF